MTVSAKDFYRSSNGDRWQLILDDDTGHFMVRHEPNLASGGRVTDVAVPEFMSRSGLSPQAFALQQLLDREGAADTDE